MFEKATRIRLRFETPAGLIDIEDLWQLPLTSNRGKVNLDDIAKDLHKKRKNDDEVSFVYKDKKPESLDQLRFDIVKHIIDVKIAEREAEADAMARKEKKQKILALIAEKQDENLRGMSLEQLTAMVNDI